MATAQTVTLEDLLANRAATYGFLSRLFKVEVDDEFLEFLRSMKVPAHTGCDAVDGGYRQIRDYLAQAGAGVITELAVDYVRTFIGSGNNGYSAAYPFESVYTLSLIHISWPLPDCLNSGNHHWCSQLITPGSMP